MFIIMDRMTHLDRQWRRKHEDVEQVDDEVVTLFVKKAFGSLDVAKKYIEKYFIGRSDNYKVSWYDHDIAHIDCYVEEFYNEWEDEDGEVGGYEKKEHRLSIIEIDNTIIY